MKKLGLNSGSLPGLTVIFSSCRPQLRLYPITTKTTQQLNEIRTKISGQISSTGEDEIQNQQIYSTGDDEKSCELEEHLFTDLF